ncbi:MAG: DUF308 domain-containing protein [Alphaproteobacteria bacterium]|nr:DUF308 domain-containing protein [Alphaproteobacteria bacterium]
MASASKNQRAYRASNNTVAQYVRRLYSRSSTLLICEAVLFAAIGVFMFVRPLWALSTIMLVAGIVLVAFGAYRTIVGLAGDGRPGTSRGLDITFGLLNVLIGILFCLFPFSVVYMFAILFLAKAVQSLVFSINMARARFGHYIFSLIVSVILVAIAVMILVFPAVGAVTMIYYLAITLLLYALADIYMYLELRRMKNMLSE